MAVTSQQVAAYEQLVESLARRLNGIESAEFDDLAQEGRILVWQALERGITPSAGVVLARMIDWIRFLRRLKRGDAVAYDLMLPIEEYGLEFGEVHRKAGTGSYRELSGDEPSTKVRPTSRRANRLRSLAKAVACIAAERLQGDSTLRAVGLDYTDRWCFA